MDGVLISQYDFHGNYSAISEIASHYAIMGGAEFMNPFLVIDLYFQPTESSGYIRGSSSNWDPKYSEDHQGFSYSDKLMSSKIWLSDGSIGSLYDNKYNFANSLNHEYNHELQAMSGLNWTPQRELMSLFAQSKHSTFDKTTSGYKLLMKSYVKDNYRLFKPGMDKYEEYNRFFNQIKGQLNSAYGTNY